MTNPTGRPESFPVDEPKRAPTFVQIRPPARPGTAYRTAGIVGVGIAVATALGWAAYRPAVHPASAPAAMQAAPSATGTPQQLVPANLEAELAELTVETAVSEPPWRRQSLMDRLVPFETPVPDHHAPAAADTRPAAQPNSYEVSVRLDKGDTIGSALQKFGFDAESIADAISVLARHVRLKRLPIGLDMTLQVRPPEAEGARPVLQALTLQPEGRRREITVERDDQGQYVVELPARPTAR
jgi:hypothetical protein